MYRSLQKFMDKLGFNFVMSRKGTVDGLAYEFIIPTSTYAPYLIDKPFQKVYDKAKKYTLVDKYRCYELWQLVQETSKLNGDVLEVGTWRGGSSLIIAEASKVNSMASKVFLFDTFTGVANATDKDSFYKGGEYSDATKEGVEKLLSDYGLYNCEVYKGVFPKDTGKYVKDKHFRFIHIDVDVYKSAQDSVGFLWNKLVVGGLIVFDDYGFHNCDGVTTLVNEYRKRDDAIIIHNLNGHAIMVKIR